MRPARVPCSSRLVLPFANPRETRTERRLGRAQVDRINVSHIEPSALATCGLLTATLKADGCDIIDVNLVIQARAGGKCAQF